jgi:hypothetical protein
VLRLGPDDPAAIAWLWQSWGTTWALRGVEERPGDAAVAARRPRERAQPVLVGGGLDAVAGDLSGSRPMADARRRRPCARARRVAAAACVSLLPLWRSAATVP